MSVLTQNSTLEVVPPPCPHRPADCVLASTADVWLTLNAASTSHSNRWSTLGHGIAVAGATSVCPCCCKHSWWCTQTGRHLDHQRVQKPLCTHKYSWLSRFPCGLPVLPRTSPLYHLHNGCLSRAPPRPAPWGEGWDALHSDLGLYVNTLPHDLALPLGSSGWGGLARYSHPNPPVITG